MQGEGRLQSQGAVGHVRVWGEPSLHASKVSVKPAPGTVATVLVRGRASALECWVRCSMLTRMGRSMGLVPVRRLRQDASGRVAVGLGRGDRGTFSHARSIGSEDSGACCSHVSRLGALCSHPRLERSRAFFTSFLFTLCAAMLTTLELLLRAANARAAEAELLQMAVREQQEQQQGQQQQQAGQQQQQLQQQPPQQTASAAPQPPPQVAVKREEPEPRPAVLQAKPKASLPKRERSRTPRLDPLEDFYRARPVEPTRSASRGAEEEDEVEEEYDERQAAAPARRRRARGGRRNRRAQNSGREREEEEEEEEDDAERRHRRRRRG